MRKFASDTFRGHEHKTRHRPFADKLEESEKILAPTHFAYLRSKRSVSCFAFAIFERLRLDAGRWEATLLGLLKGTKLVGHFFGRIEELERVATRLNRRWIKNRGTRAAAIA
jgi:hypothetical protein